MICKSCGHLLSDNDKFCPECGTRVVVDASQVASERPVTQGGRDAMGRTDGTPAPSASQGKERNKRHFQFEEIDWNLDGYPTEQKKATDDLLKAVNIRNWERVEEQKNDYNASQMRNKVMMMGLLAAGAVGAIIFYKITFGIF